MVKFAVLISLVFLSLTFPGQSLAANSNNFVTIVNPIRGSEFWADSVTSPSQAALNELDLIKPLDLPSTWLFRFDALNDSNIVQNFKTSIAGIDRGLLLEITPSLAAAANVPYHKSSAWHNAGSVFLTGYNPSDRQKLVDMAMAKFKDDFGVFPKSVGAWWIDSNSLDYLSSKYGVVASLEVADQYSTDNYQIWGQYWGTPYYPARHQALRPAQNNEEKIPVVISQWASRDPVNGYGNGVEESTYSFQANDYLDYHALNTTYFNKLLDLYLNQPLNQFNQVTIGLENSYSNSRYVSEYKNQLASIKQKLSVGQLKVATMADFSNWYQLNFPNLSPTQIIVAKDPLGSAKQAVWFMNNFYRLGWFYKDNVSEISDLRQYVTGSNEICLDSPCQSLNFATNATRVLDNVSFGQSYVLDRGGIHDFKINQNGQSYNFSYLNEANTLRQVSLLARDVSIDNKNSSIDSFILQALATPSPDQRYKLGSDQNLSSVEQDNMALEVLSGFKFLIFLMFVILIPGLGFLKLGWQKSPTGFFLPVTLGIVFISLASYLIGFWGSYGLVLIPIALVDILLILKRQIYFIRPKLDLLLFGLVVLGTLFQVLPTVQSGLAQSFGIGFWGPNGHDGIWHLSLINQLANGLPPQNPVFGGTVLKNYHYLYDLLIAVTHLLTQIPISDLVFRFYPVLFSVLLGLGSFALANQLFKSRAVAYLSVFFIYFCGSFGWVVTYLKDHNLAGESAFWANQSSSYNLNPPFAISLLIMIALFCLLSQQLRGWSYVILGVVLGSLISFKSYAGVLAVIAICLVSLDQLIRLKNPKYLISVGVAGLVSLSLFLPNFSKVDQTFVWSPFWLIHSMIDSPDRVGWERLSIGRIAYITRGDWLKFVFVELIGLVLFIGGNLGTRIVGLPALLSQPFHKTSQTIFIIIIGVLGLIIPLLFIQSGTSWNVVQFFYYSIYLMSLLAGFGLYKIYQKLPRFAALFLIAIILIISPINAWAVSASYLTHSPHAFVPPSEVNALQALRAAPSGIVLTYPYDKTLKNSLEDPRPIFAYETTGYVSAFSGHPAFLEDEIQNQILGNDYLKRLAEIKDFFNQPNPDLARNFLITNKIKYIYLPKFYNLSLDSKVAGLGHLYENDRVIIYKLNN